jgi:hypothetical protein
MKMTRASTEMPPRHMGIWRVWRPGHGYFDATVCYGMHEPWWVPRNNFTRDESEPTPIQDDDMWGKQPDLVIAN